MTQLALQTLTNRLHRRIYRSPTSGTYPSDPRRCRSAAARSSQRCRGRQTRSFSTKLANLTTNGYVYVISQASFMNLRSSVLTFLAHRFGVKSLCSYARCGMTDAKLFAVTLHPLALIAACGARWNRASRAWQHPCCNLSVLQSRGDGGPTAGARPRGEPLCERRMEESASPT